MKITNHATKRFLERVLKKRRYSYQEFKKANDLLKKHFANIKTHRNTIPLPNFKGYMAIVQENTVVTIIPKDRGWHKKIKIKKGSSKKGVDRKVKTRIISHIYFLNEIEVK